VLSNGLWRRSGLERAHRTVPVELKPCLAVRDRPVAGFPDFIERWSRCRAILGVVGGLLLVGLRQQSAVDLFRFDGQR